MTFPEDYAGRGRGQGGGVHRHGQRGEGAGPLHHRRGLGEGAGLRGSGRAEGDLRQALHRRVQEPEPRPAEAALLDRLAADYPFAVPEGMVDLEFEAIWKQLQDEMERTGDKFGEDGKSEEALKAEYRADRRAARAAGPDPLRPRHQERGQGRGRGAAAGGDARGDALPRPGAQGVRVLQEQPAALEQLRAPCSRTRSATSSSSRCSSTDQPVTIEELMKDPDDEEPEGGARPPPRPPSPAAGPLTIEAAHDRPASSCPWWSSRPPVASAPTTSTRGCSRSGSSS